MTSKRRRTRRRRIQTTWLQRKKSSATVTTSTTPDIALIHPMLPYSLSQSYQYDVSYISYLGILASAVPFLLPNPRCLPIRLAAVNSLALALECMVTGLRIMRPSETSLRIVWRELACPISVISLGSSQILRLPQPTTAAARRFWVRRLTLMSELLAVWASMEGRKVVR